MPIPNLSLCGPSSCHVCCSLTCLPVILDIFKISFQRRLIFKIFFSRHLQTLKMIGSFWDLPSARTFIFHLAIYKTFGRRLLCCLWHRAGTPSLTWSSIHKGWETIRGQWNHVWLSFFFSLQFICTIALSGGQEGWREYCVLLPVLPLAVVGLPFESKIESKIENSRL